MGRHTPAASVKEIGDRDAFASTLCFYVGSKGLYSSSTPNMFAREPKLRNVGGKSRDVLSTIVRKASRCREERTPLCVSTLYIACRVYVSPAPTHLESASARGTAPLCSRSTRAFPFQSSATPEEKQLRSMGLHAKQARVTCIHILCRQFTTIQPSPVGVLLCWHQPKLASRLLSCRHTPSESLWKQARARAHGKHELHLFIYF